MFILPSRERPHNIKRLVDACIKTKTSLPITLRLDENDPSLGGYLTSYPKNWNIIIECQKPLSEIYNEFSLDYKWYGFIADDIIPKTNYWDVKLVELAGNDGMAAPKGGHEDTTVIPHFVLGGDLVRETGFVCLPGLDRTYIDTVWNDIAKEKNVLRYSDVVLEHLHFSNKKALFDKTYKKHHKKEDKLIYEEWKNGHIPKDYSYAGLSDNSV